LYYYKRYKKKPKLNGKFTETEQKSAKTSKKKSQKQVKSRFVVTKNFVVTTHNYLIIKKLSAW